MIAIKYANTELFNKKWPFIHQFLVEEGYESQLTAFEDWEVNTGIFDPVKAVEDLRSNNCRVMIVNLSTIVPGTMPDDMTVAAVSDRAEHFDQIIYRPATDVEGLVPLKDGQKIVVTDDRQAYQLIDLFPHITTEVMDYAYLDLNNPEVEGFMISLENIGSEPIEGFDQFTFHPKEFIPCAGQNVIAIICRKSDLEMIELFRKIHQATIASCTNIERKFAQKVKELGYKGVGAYCILDDNQYYHFYAGFYAADQLRYIRRRYSAGTSGGMVEEMVEQMLKIV